MSVIQFTEPVVKHTTVTVQNVMIGKRQLTQRVFKQIKRESIFNPNIANKLQGDAWGYVNYFWKGDGELKYFKSKHILWITEDGELRRDLIVNKLSHWYGDFNEFAALYLITELPQLYIAV